MLLLNALLSGFGEKFAYLDPGSGSVIIQLLIAALLGVGIAVRASWGKIKGLFGIKSETDDDDEDLDE